jgi:hypothetical protein
MRRMPGMTFPEDIKIVFGILLQEKRVSVSQGLPGFF